MFNKGARNTNTQEHKKNKENIDILDQWPNPFYFFLYLLKEVDKKIDRLGGKYWHYH